MEVSLYTCQATIFVHLFGIAFRHILPLTAINVLKCANDLKRFRSNGILYASMYKVMILQVHTLKTATYHDANFIVTDGTGSATSDDKVGIMTIHGFFITVTS